MIVKHTMHTEAVPIVMQAKGKNPEFEPTIQLRNIFYIENSSFYKNVFIRDLIILLLFKMLLKLKPVRKSYFLQK